MWLGMSQNVETKRMWKFVSPCNMWTNLLEAECPRTRKLIKCRPVTLIKQDPATRMSVQKMKGNLCLSNHSEIG